MIEQEMRVEFWQQENFVQTTRGYFICPHAFEKRAEYTVRTVLFVFYYDMIA